MASYVTTANLLYITPDVFYADLKQAAKILQDFQITVGQTQTGVSFQQISAFATHFCLGSLFDRLLRAAAGRLRTRQPSGIPCSSIRLLAFLPKRALAPLEPAQRQSGTGPFLGPRSRSGC